MFQRPSDNARGTANRIFVLAVLFGLAALSACSTTAPQMQPTSVPATSTPLPPPTAEPTQPPAPTAVPATPTLQPSATALPPTPTALPEQMTAWCMPIEFTGAVNYAGGVAIMPSGGRPATLENGIQNLRIPAVSCTFSFQFSQAPAAGAKLEFFEGKSQTPWLSADLVQSPDNPNVVFATLIHPYIINPPFWSIQYPFDVKMADGTVKFSSQARFYQPIPFICVNKDIPNPVTLECLKADPKEVEPHRPRP